MAMHTRSSAARELAAKAGVTPRVLRKPLRREFDQKDKTKVHSNRLEYCFHLSARATHGPIARLESLLGKRLSLAAMQSIEDSTTRASLLQMPRGSEGIEKAE